MTETTSLSVEERRERRRQKILNNGKARLEALLHGGPDGVNRQAPALDGLATFTSTSILENFNNSEKKQKNKMENQSENMLKRLNFKI